MHFVRQTYHEVFQTTRVGSIKRRAQTCSTLTACPWSHGDWLKSPSWHGPSTSAPSILSQHQKAPPVQQMSWKAPPVQHCQHWCKGNGHKWWRFTFSEAALKECWWSHLPRLCIYTPCDHTVALGLMHVHTENPRPQLIEFNVFGCYQKSKCKIEHTTVDGKYPSPVDTVVVSCSHYLQGVIYISGGAVFPSTVFYHFKDLYKSSLELVVSSAKKHTSHATPMLCHQLQGARLCGFVDRMGTNLMPNFSEKHPRILPKKKSVLKLHLFFWSESDSFKILEIYTTKVLKSKKKRDLYSPSSNYHPFHEFSDLFFKHPLFQHPFLTEVSHALEVLKLC